jgi:hypothetical protein
MMLKFTFEFKSTLNVKADTPTVTGRIYPRKVLEDALSKFAERPIFSGPSTNSIRDIVGFVSEATMDDDGVITIRGTAKENVVKALDLDRAYNFSLDCIGELGGGNTVARISSVNAVRVVAKDKAVEGG